MALFEKLKPSSGRIDLDPDPHVDSESDIEMGKQYLPNAFYKREYGINFQMKFPSRFFGQCDPPKRFKYLNLSILELNCAQID